MAKFLFLSALGLLTSISVFTQTTIHIAFNVSNCEAHSRQIRSLAELDPEVPKYLLINRLDSSLAPWISERFVLHEVRSLQYRYLPGKELGRLFDRGRSVVIVISASDTVFRFPLDELPAQISRINAMARGALEYTDAFNVDSTYSPKTLESSIGPIGAGRSENLSGLRYTKIRLLSQEGLPPIGSGASFASGRKKVWLLDHFFDRLYRIDVSNTDVAILEMTGNLATLLANAQFGQQASVWPEGMVIQSADIISVGPITDLPVIHLALTDTVAERAAVNAQEYHRVLLHLEEKGTASVLVLDYSERDDELFPFLSSSGYIERDEQFISQVYHFSTSRDTYPLFGNYKVEGDSLKLVGALPYDYRTRRWTDQAPYSQVNGRLCSEHFAFAIAPLVVDTRTWEETDISQDMTLSMDSIFASIPMKYFMIDMKCDTDRITMLCWVNDGLELIRFMVTEGKLALVKRARIETGSFRSRGATLMDNGDAILVSESLDQLMMISFEP